MPSEALRVFAQTVFEKGVSEQDVVTMISRNPHDLLDLDSAAAAPRPVVDADPCLEPHNN
jgi:dihydroorotase-like cyclic amidohydrolase